MSDKLPNRKKIRFENYDYSDFGVYYITVCTKDKQRIFWTNKTFSAYKVLGDAGISVGVVLRPQVMTDILLQTKFYKYNKTTDIVTGG